MAKKQYDSIQLMRGLAALTVIFMHIQMIKRGAFGVELFFCISGFIMMHVTQRGYEHFFTKRLIRIVPLYWLAAFLTAAILVIAPAVFRTLVFKPEFFVKTLLFLPFYYKGASGSTVNSLVQVGWTLMLEMFYYVLFYISTRISQKHRHYISSLILIVLVTVGSIVKTDNTFVRFYCQPVMLEFIFGMFSYKLLTNETTRAFKSFGKSVCVVSGCVLWLFLFFIDDIPYVERMDRFIKYGLISFAVFLLLFKGFENCSIPKPLIALGNISYSLYLTHSFVVQGFSRLIYNIDVYTPLGVVLVIAVVLPLCLFVAWLSWFIIEDRFTAYLRRKLIK